MQEAGIEIPDGYVQVSEFNPGDGYRCMRSLIDLANPPDAVVCANDQIAAGALRAICDSGLRCPEDIMLIGVDNSEITIVTSPTLSSFELPLYEMGQYAARGLLNQLVDEVCS